MPAALRRLTALALFAIATADAAHAADPRGRWITENGNLEVEIADCGPNLCGHVAKVLGNKSMMPGGGEMKPVDTRPALGMKILIDLAPSGGNPPSEWTGSLYNRENAKTYRGRLRMDGEALEVRGYVGLPLFGRTQRWTRAGAAPAAASAPAAPELAGIEAWINAEPLSMNRLRGQVVLVDFWTYDCGNCINTLPHLRAWHERYRERGLTVIGVHTPEFAHERDPGKVRDAVARLKVPYAVAHDPRNATWNAWGVRAWPTLYLVDRQGRIVFRHVGEGDYDEIERRIRAALEAG